ncbi:phage antirepressor KilAC domain-containing protein [Rhodococcus sp. IEGM 1330]|uniref:phage antirepressor KilAC domain-containing protein n=1 Tax=Rhodococcus sp. IEGM 1330 TaxID=3082225 RepID=UPI0029558275|nr:phage antirepressor KilAC domain-containing protein [Rhodococcus sp. IEGM 1330]MDV8022320.1 phage antirepressor KilAC domain-containing protein [Rhodococcus sp. IEGM 1330]
MSDLTVPTGSPFDDGRTPCPQGGEDKWSARWLMGQMGYPTWQHFEPVVERAKVAAHNQGFNVKILFTVNREKTGGRPSLDYLVTRFAAYLIAMNGDPRKPEVAAAQAYFAIRTREAETVQPLTGKDLLAAAVLEAQATIAAKDERIAELEPKASYVDVFVAGSDLLTFRTVASTLDVGEQWLRETLLERGWIYAERSSRWSDRKGKVPQTRYSEYSNKKLYFRRVENHDAPRFNGEVMHTLKITAAGANAIAKAVARWQSEVAA